MISALKNSAEVSASQAAFSTVDVAELSTVEGGCGVLAGVIVGAVIGVAVLYVAYKAYEGYTDGQKAGGCAAT